MNYIVNTIFIYLISEAFMSIVVLITMITSIYHTIRGRKLIYSLWWECYQYESSCHRIRRMFMVDKLVANISAMLLMVLRLMTQLRKDWNMLLIFFNTLDKQICSKNPVLFVRLKMSERFISFTIWLLELLNKWEVSYLLMILRSHWTVWAMAYLSNLS